MKSGSSTFYGGVPIEQVDFDAEFEKELAQLKTQIEEIEEKKKSKGSKFNSRYWAIKLNRANKALQDAQVTLD
jgi:hypothetical protein